MFGRKRVKINKIKFWRDFFIIAVKNYLYKRRTRLKREQLRKMTNIAYCTCGYEFRFPWAVLHRSVSCSKCRRGYWYERDLKMNFTFKRNGRYKTKGELERELEAYGRYYAKN